VIVHFPEGGAVLGHDGQFHEHASVKLPESYIKGAAGAGDAFTAGVLLAWHEGLPIQEWLRYGVCTAAANLADETCTGGMLPLAQVLEIGARHGFRS
jgi:sugar/nucleoside kinase (ribokinase family)